VEEMSERKSGKVMAEELAQFVNGASRSEKEAFVNQMLREHRTLQQSTMALMMKLIEGWALTENYDGRNENTGLLSKKILLSLKEGYYLPLI